MAGEGCLYFSEVDSIRSIWRLMYALYIDGCLHLFNPLKEGKLGIAVSLTSRIKSDIDYCIPLTSNQSCLDPSVIPIPPSPPLVPGQNVSAHSNF